MADRRAPIDRVVDLAVAAPAAAFVAALRAMPIAAKAGTLGAAKAIERVSETVAAMRETDDGAPTAVGGAHTMPEARDGQSAGDPDDAAADDGIENRIDGARDDEPTQPAELPIEGYDDLAARQVVARLEGLDADGLHLIAAYERSHRNRSTVLGKVASLQE